MKTCAPLLSAPNRTLAAKSGGNRVEDAFRRERSTAPSRPCGGPCRGLSWAEWLFRIGGGDRAILLSIGLSFLSVMAGLGWLAVRPLRRNRRLLRTGRLARATILKVRRTGISTSRLAGTRRLLDFDLQVHPESGADYEAHTTRSVSPAELDAFAPGVEVAVRFDPAKPARVAIESPVSPSPA